MIPLLKETLRPASIACLLMLIAPGVVLLFVPPLARWARRWLLLVAAAYWVLSTPWTTALLALTLTHGLSPIASADQVRGAQVVVLLGAGTFNVRSEGDELPLPNSSTALRTIEAARVYRMAGSPLVIASGGLTDRSGQGAPESEAMRRALLQLHVPADRIVLESESVNTRDEAIIIARMLRERHLTHVVLVTSPLHMRRAAALFAAQGVETVQAVTPLTADTGAVRRLLPSDAALWLGDEIVYEWAAHLYYRWHGWI